MWSNKCCTTAPPSPCGPSFGLEYFVSGKIETCGVCGSRIETYEDCQKASAAALGDEGLAGAQALRVAEEWDGPFGCHVQAEGNGASYHVQFNSKRALPGKSE